MVKPIVSNTKTSLWKRLQCSWNHDWHFDGGEWVIPKTHAVTRRLCVRCGLWQEICQDHVLGMRFIEREEKTTRHLSEQATTQEKK